MTHLLFWPLRLREPHLVHAQHALAAGVLAQQGAEVLLALDTDRETDPSTADDLKAQMTEAVTSWIPELVPSENFAVVTVDEIVAQKPDLDPDAEAWRVFVKYARDPTTSIWNFIRASKVVPFAASSETVIKTLEQPSGWRLADPPRLWLAVNTIIGDNPGRRIITLGGEDEEMLWSEWRRPFGGDAVSHLFAPQLQGATSVWNLTFLRLGTPMGSNAFVNGILGLRSELSRDLLDWVAYLAALLDYYRSRRGEIGADQVQTAEDLKRLFMTDDEKFRSEVETIAAWFSLR